MLFTKLAAGAGPPLPGLLRLVSFPVCNIDCPCQWWCHNLWAIYFFSQPDQKKTWKPAFCTDPCLRSVTIEPQNWCFELQVVRLVPAETQTYIRKLIETQTSKQTSILLKGYFLPFNRPPNFLIWPWCDCECFHFPNHWQFSNYSAAALRLIQRAGTQSWRQVAGASGWTALQAAAWGIIIVPYHFEAIHLLLLYLEYPY